MAAPSVEEIARIMKQQEETLAEAQKELAELRDMAEELKARIKEIQLEEEKFRQRHFLY